MEVQFRMKVLNIFRLSNGRTVFAGDISGHPGLIKSCSCELRREDIVRDVIEIEGEQIVKKVDPNNTLRSLATIKDIDMTKEEAQSGDWELVPINNK
jgi:hypothetical protein